jgi:hypothetical protein
VIGAGNRQVETYHVPGERYLGIQGCRAGVIAHSNPYPGNAGLFGLLDSHLGRAAHHQVAHSVVAIHQGGRRMILHDSDVGSRVHSTGSYPPHVLRQPKNTVPIRPAQIGRDHELRDASGI